MTFKNQNSVISHQRKQYKSPYRMRKEPYHIDFVSQLFRDEPFQAEGPSTGGNFKDFFGKDIERHEKERVIRAKKI